MKGVDGYIVRGRGGYGTGYGSRYSGQSVRPVQGFTK